MSALWCHHRSPLAARVGKTVTLTQELTDPASGAVYPAGTRARVAQAYRGLTLRLGTAGVIRGVGVECVREASGR